MKKYLKVSSEESSKKDQQFKERRYIVYTYRVLLLGSVYNHPKPKLISLELFYIRLYNDVSFC